VRILKSDHAGRPRKSFAAVPPEPDEIRMVPIPKVFEVNPEKFGELSRLYMEVAVLLERIAPTLAVLGSRWSLIRRGWERARSRVSQVVHRVV
jgi:hypothetical protein